MKETKKLLSIIITISFLFAACNATQEKDTSGSAERKAEITPENVVLIDMDVNGMTCTGCENTIKTGVSELAGVVSVEASHTDAKTYVKVDTSLTSLEMISEKITSKGYEVIGAKFNDLTGSAEDKNKTE